MNSQAIKFAIAGLIGGVICVAIGAARSPELIVIGLIWLVGPLFFAAMLTSMLITGASRQFRRAWLRYLAGLVICTVAYAIALLVFFVVVGFSPAWLGFEPSSSISGFGFDIWLGLVAAAVVGASGITAFAAVLTGAWSNLLLQRLMLAGLLVISITFVGNFPFKQEWSFFGLLFPLGNAAFGYLVVVHVSRNTERQRYGVL